MTALATRPTPEILVKNAWVPEGLAARLKGYTPKSELGKIARECFSYLPVYLAADLLEQISRTVILESSLQLSVIRANGKIEELGIVGRKVITTVGVGFLVDAWQNIVEMEIQKYHGLGTGSTAEANGDTALVTELTTEYTGDVRATGSLTEGASANIFRTLGTNTLDGTPGAALREHGIFSASTVGVLWDRTVFSAITLSSGDGLASTYDLTASAGG